MAKSAVIDDDRADGVAPSQSPLAHGAAGVRAALPQVSPGPAANAPAPRADVPASGDSDAPAAGMASEPQTGTEVTPPSSPPPSEPSNPAPANAASTNNAPMSADDLERAKSLAKLRILDWVRQKTRDDPASLALRMPYLQSRLKAWEEAKASDDAGRMTKAYNDLLRGLEAEQNRRGIPKDQQRVLPNDMAEDVARGILNAEPAKMLEKLRAAKADHGEYADGMVKQIGSFLPDALKFADGQSSKLMGELVWKRNFEAPGIGARSPQLDTSTDQDPAAEGQPVSGSLPQTVALQAYDRRTQPPTFQSRNDPLSAAKQPYRIERWRSRHAQDARARAPLFNASERDQRDAPAHWANPDIGWSRDEMIETAADLGNRPLTVETLQVLSNLIYEEEPVPGRPGEYRTLFGDERLRATGWQKFYEINDRRTGFCAVALYNPISKVVIVVNRGTDFSKNAADAFKDEMADYNIFMGKRSEQLGQAREFLAEVWRRMGRDSGTQVVLTGHSLGGALVQMQLGASLTEQQFQGMNVVGVTFAALGAEDAVLQHLRGSVPYNVDVTRLRRMAADRLLNFARDGDGFTLRDALIGFPARSRVLGRTRQLAGLGSAEMTNTEDEYNHPERHQLGYGLFAGPDDLLQTRASALLRLPDMYLRNHDSRSFYSDDFTAPLERVLPFYRAI